MAGAFDTVMECFFDGETPARRQSLREQVRRLQALNVDVDQRFDYRGTRGWTLLLMAASLGLTGVIKVLLKHSKADVNNATADNGCTALANAVEEGHLGTIRLLLQESNADVNKATTDRGCTPLHIACQEKMHDVIELLLREGKPNVNQRRIDTGSVPLMTAAEKGDATGVLLLLRLAQPPPQVDLFRFSDGMTALGTAAVHGHLDVCKALVRVGKADVNFAPNGNNVRPTRVGVCGNAGLCAVEPRQTWHECLLRICQPELPVPVRRYHSA